MIDVGIRSFYEVTAIKVHVNAAKLNLVLLKNGNAPLITQVVEGVENIIAPATAEEKAQRRNKLVIDTLSLDDLYNNLKIYEPEVKGTSRSNTNTQNVAFLSSNNTISINGAVNTGHGVSTASTQATTINLTTIDNLSDANQEDVNDAIGSKKKTVVVTFDPLALIVEKTNVSRSKEKVVVSSDSEGSEADDFSELKKITALLAKAFNRRKFYSKPTNNNLRTSSSSQSANKKQEFFKIDTKKVEKKDMSRGFGGNGSWGVVRVVMGLGFRQKKSLGFYKVYTRF
uniref:Uncharacterized protein n=1 Tax=Tanacetum cinerariifolium TaxID=118510 RepID=A0A6L2LDF1_TANCI|nr:hypothetical protein [Tanacetum cinerariifolium]